ncbi:hypothetical protein PUN28_001268 [Cardiocondyla obscurior]|uniref:Uncharacterized protein n=1 Tax=Cardiocondyla obscurior TaxID=286306 RepID=A0AAW2H4T7_9HYME
MRRAPSITFPFFQRSRNCLACAACLCDTTFLVPPPPAPRSPLVARCSPLTTSRQLPAACRPYITCGRTSKDLRTFLANEDPISGENYFLPSKLFMRRAPSITFLSFQRSQNSLACAACLCDTTTSKDLRMFLANEDTIPGENYFLPSKLFMQRAPSITFPSFQRSQNSLACAACLCDTTFLVPPPSTRRSSLVARCSPPAACCPPILHHLWKDIERSTHVFGERRYNPGRKLLPPIQALYAEST